MSNYIPNRTGELHSTGNTFPTRHAGEQPLPTGVTWIPVLSPPTMVDYITVVSTPDKTPAGKRIEMRDGKPVKVSLGDKPAYTAQTVPIRRFPEDLQSVLAGLQSHQAIILGAVPGTEDGAPFMLVSEAQLSESLNLPRGAFPLGVFEFPGYPGCKYCARLKENFQYSTVRLFDVDVPDDMPKHLIARDFKHWQDMMQHVCLELVDAAMLCVPSASGRVEGPLGPVFPRGGMHIYVQTESAQAPAQWESALFINAYEAGLMWMKPSRYRRGENAGGVCAETPAPIWDRTAMQGSQRLVFECPPVLGDSTQSGGYRVTPLKAETTAGGRWDTRKVKKPVQRVVQAFERACGLKVRKDGTSGNVSLVRNELTWDTVVHRGCDPNTGRYTRPITLGGIRDSGEQHVRIEADWRGSTSQNAFVGRQGYGELYIYDNGTHVKHELTEEIKGQLSLKIGSQQHAEVATALVAEISATPVAPSASVTAPVIAPVTEAVNLTDASLVSAAALITSTADDSQKRFVYITDGNRVADLDAPPNTAVMLHREWHNNTLNYPLVDGALFPNAWMKSANRPTVRGCRWVPGGPRIITAEGEQWYNEFYVPEFAYTTDEDRLGPLWDQLRFMFPDEGRLNIFLSWMAHTIHHPEDRIQFVPLLIANEHGIGRGWLTGLIGALLGHWNCSNAEIGILAGDGSAGAYQDYLYQKLFCAIPEVRVEGKGRYAVDDKIRDKLTDHHLNLNLKYGTNGTHAVYANMMMSSNSRDALVLPPEDRRMWVHEIDAKPRPESHYTHLYGLLSDPLFLAQTWSYLKRWSEAGAFKPGQRAPRTPERAYMVRGGQSATERAVREFLKGENNPPVATYGYIRASVAGLMAAEEEMLDEGQLKIVLKQRCLIANGSRKMKVKGSPVNVWVLDQETPRSWVEKTDAVRARIRVILEKQDGTGLRIV